nr:oleosin-B6-like [Procambarus clarkii]
MYTKDEKKGNKALKGDIEDNMIKSGTSGEKSTSGETPTWVQRRQNRDLKPDGRIRIRQKDMDSFVFVYCQKLERRDSRAEARLTKAAAAAPAAATVPATLATSPAAAAAPAAATVPATLATSPAAAAAPAAATVPATPSNITISSSSSSRVSERAPELSTRPL